MTSVFWEPEVLLPCLRMLPPARPKLNELSSVGQEEAILINRQAGAGHASPSLRDQRATIVVDANRISCSIYGAYRLDGAHVLDLGVSKLSVWKLGQKTDCGAISLQSTQEA
ncbi:MAG: hypothetical protein I8H71_00760 [Xanthomonadaceae bacterium]|nr:hypothetical protein [Xanthomonadaceae bacterium]